MLHTSQKDQASPPIRLLLVDDHGICRAGLKVLFETQPDLQIIAEAEDGEAAVRLTLQLKPDVLLLDLELPKQSGIDVLAELRRLEVAVKTIILTASIDRRQIIEAVQLGACGVVLKEATSELLFKAIHGVMAGEYWVDRGRVSELAEALYNSACTPATVSSKNRFGLTPREHQIVAAILSGYSNRDIAQRLSISTQTVKNHLTTIYQKVGVSTRLELALCASSTNSTIHERTSRITPPNSGVVHWPRRFFLRHRVSVGAPERGASCGRPARVSISEKPH